MILNIYTVYDSAALAYLPPFFLPTPSMATRSFAQCVNDPTHAFGKHPHDYTLFTLGHYDDSSAELITNAPQSMGNGLEFVNPPDQDVPNVEPISDGPSIQSGSSR